MQRTRLGDVGARCHIVRYPDIAANAGALAYGNAAQHRGAGIDHNIVLHNRMAWQALQRVAFSVVREAFGAQRHGLVDAHALADDRRFTNHNAGAMVNEETGVYAGARMDVDAGLPMRQLGNDARQQRHTLAVQLVSNPVVDHGQYAGIAQQHFVHTVRGRVTVIRRQYVTIEQGSNARQCMGKRAHQLHGIFFNVLLPCALDVARRVAQLQPHLRQQGVQHGIQRVPYVKVFALLAQIGGPQAHWKQHAAQAIEHLRQRITRGQLPTARLCGAVLRLAPAMAFSRQIGHHALDVEQGHAGISRLEGVQTHGLVLHPWQTVQAPAVLPTTVLLGVNLTFKALQHIEDPREPGLGRRLGCGHRALATAAQQQHRSVLADLGFQLAHKARVAGHAGAAGPGHVHAAGYVADKLALLCGAYVH